MISNNFKNDVLNGLSAERKFLSSKYFYDDNGSRIFQKIMKMKDYYLPECETEILTIQSAQIVQEVAHEQLDIIELGAGDGSKSVLLLEAFVKAGKSIRYIPFDISSEILQDNLKNVKSVLPGVPVELMAGDYFDTLKKLDNYHSPKLVMFMGSNIGNFKGDKGLEFIRFVNGFLQKGDYLLMGTDLKKHPETILAAYFDQEGITAKFNLNLLKRINRELHADFDLTAFEHYASYDPITGAALSYLISLQDQIVTIGPEKHVFHFHKFEAIHTEVSQKYSLKDLKLFGEKTGFAATRHFLDKKGYFSLSLFIK
jgi:L-histidine Nalpha-methyltransferase